MEENQKILLCEDDENLGMLLREYLQAKGYETDLCSDGEAGYRAFLKTPYNICVLDVMMPKKDGFTLAQEIRSVNPDIPIIFLTAKTLKEDILEGFKIGADDYICKPFNPLELVARVKALMRRTEPPADGREYSIGSLFLSPDKHITTIQFLQILRICFYHTMYHLILHLFHCINEFLHPLIPLFLYVYVPYALQIPQLVYEKNKFEGTKIPSLLVCPVRRVAIILHGIKKSCTKHNQ